MTDALFHVSAKVFKRSEGRSAVAAAAYRSASKLHDQRTGETFDYRKKHVVDSFILTPDNAPDWTLERETLWNNVESSEVRKNSVVARELEVSIPRDLPPSQWKAFAEHIVKPYVSTGAIADIGIHCPVALDKEAQPHLHIMLSLRQLDASTDSGFSKNKNDDLIRFFESGGRLGGTRTDALKSERERISIIMNDFLAQNNSEKRTDHRSYKERQIDKIPEPKISEQRLAAAKNRKKGDRRTEEIFKLRQSKKHQEKLEAQLKHIERNIMIEKPITQTLKNQEKERQEFKRKLLSNHLPGIHIDACKLHMVDVKNPEKLKMQFVDGGWLELENKKITLYGDSLYADQFADEVVKKGLALEKERYEETASFSSKSLKNPELSQEQVESLADRWRSRGYTDIVETDGGVWLTVGQSRLFDSGADVKIFGTATPDAVNALLVKAADEWNGEIELFGTREFKDKVYLEAQQRNIKIFDKNTGQAYVPSAEILAQINAKNSASAPESLESLIKKTASLDKDAAAKVKAREPEIYAFLSQHLDAKQLKSLSAEDLNDIKQQLENMRKLGQKALENNRTHSHKPKF